ncbi:MAG TPA: thioesterase family protein [Thermoanaerobaculia bacterium]
MRTVDLSLRVRYSETDAMGIVYHANYLVWFEIGRTEFCRVAGYPYRSMEDSGLWILVTEVECRYRKSARYDDEILVRTAMPELGSRIVAFGYEIFGPGNALLADGRTRHVFADPTGKPRRAPKEILEGLERFRSSDK